MEGYYWQVLGQIAEKKRELVPVHIAYLRGQEK